MCATGHLQALATTVIQGKSLNPVFIRQVCFKLMDMLQHTGGGLELWYVCELNNILKGYHAMLFSEYLGRNWLKVFFLEEADHGDQNINSRLREHSWGQDM